MSILLTVAALIVVSVLPGKEAGDTHQKGATSVNKLEYVENAMRSFAAFHGRRPCPADGQYPVNSQYFGVEAAIAGTCTGGTPSAPLGPDVVTGNIVGGTIPTKTLGIPDDYAFDEWGRRFTYVVDMRATSLANCDKLMDAPTNDGVGGILIKNATSGSTLDTVMYAYISHGPSGYGAWPAQGAATPAGRINSGSTDGDMQTNAGVDAHFPSGPSSFNYTTGNFTNVFVKKDRVAPVSGGDTGFDDIVWYRPDIKNTCCIGAICTPLGFRVDAGAAGWDFHIVGVGDINGDGIPDLVIWPNNGGWTGSNYVYVIFGTANTGQPVWAIPPDGLDPTTLNGKDGFVIWNGMTGCCQWGFNGVTVADLNGDGNADIILSVWGIVAVIFGGSDNPSDPNYRGAWPSGINVASLNGWTGVNGTNGFVITDDGYNSSWGNNNYLNGSSAIGKIDDSGYNSLIVSGTDPYVPIAGTNPWSSSYSGGFVLFGKPDTGVGPNGASDNWHSIPALIHVSDITIANNNGFHFYNSGGWWYLWPVTDAHGTIGDMNNDGYADLMFGSPWGFLMVYGRTHAQWQSVLTTDPDDGVALLDTAGESAGTPAMLTASPGLNAPSNRASYFYGSNYYCCNGGGPSMEADVNNDGVPDLLLGGTGNYSGGIVMYGKTDKSVWPASFDMAYPAPSQGFAMDLSGHPSWMTGNYANMSAGDVNGDGCTDIILGLGSWTGQPLGRTNAGAYLVFLQPKSGGKCSGWNTSWLSWSQYHWDGTDSFYIYGPAEGDCGDGTSVYVANVRPETGTQKPEIIVSCQWGGAGTGNGAVYGLYENNGWPSSIDLQDLNP